MQQQDHQHLTFHHAYMMRCLELAKKGAGYVAPNPMVGAVLVHKGRILGEGWHKRYGEPHAEVNCLASVRQADRHLIAQSTMYVSLEPCAHHGRTPPCADLIVRHQIPEVVIGCVDSFAKVAGKGIEKLKQAGINVILEGPWQAECLRINRRFFTFHSKHRPYILLKWAQTADRFIAPIEQIGYTERLLISEPVTNRLVHKWRSENAAILVGSRTAIKDNPSLNNRYYSGPSPIRMAIDAHLEIPTTASLMQPSKSTVIFNQIKDVAATAKSPAYAQMSPEGSVPAQIAAYCYKENIQSILVEGGRMTLQSFIDQDLWDECRIITNTKLKIGVGLPAPILQKKRLIQSIELGQDKINYFAPHND